MKKFFAAAAGLLVGAVLAIALHCSFMTAEMSGASMLPAIEPGQKVLVFLLADDEAIKEGDVVAYRSPFHEIGGGNVVGIRRVAETAENELTLACEWMTVGEDSLSISREDVLGKVILF